MKKISPKIRVTERSIQAPSKQRLLEIADSTLYADLCLGPGSITIIHRLTFTGQAKLDCIDANVRILESVNGIPISDPRLQQAFLETDAIVHINARRIKLQGTFTFQLDDIKSILEQNTIHSAGHFL